MGLIRREIDIVHTLRRISGNAGYATLGSIADSGLLFVLLTIAGRFLGPVAYGDFFTAYIFVNIAFRLTEAGLDVVINREVARDRDAAGYYLENALCIRLVTISAAGLLLLAGLALTAYPPPVVQGVAILAVYTGIWQLSRLFVDIFRAYERMDLATLVIVAERGVALLAGVGFVLLKDASLLGIELAFVLGGLVRFGIALALARRIVGWPHLRIDVPFWRELLRKSLPLGLTSVLTMVYFRVDTFLLSLMISDSSQIVGWYNAAYMIFSGATLPAIAVYFSVFPTFSRLHVTSPAQLRALYRIVLPVLIVVSIIIGVGTYIFADDLIRLIYGGGYRDSVTVLKVMAFAILPTYLVFLVNATLPAVDCVRDFVITVGVAAASNVAMNLILIPHYGALGAAFATTLAQFVPMVVGMGFVFRYFRKLRHAQPRSMGLEALYRW